MLRDHGLISTRRRMAAEFLANLYVVVCISSDTTGGQPVMFCLECCRNERESRSRDNPARGQEADFDETPRRNPGQQLEEATNDLRYESSDNCLLSQPSEAEWVVFQIFHFRDRSKPSPKPAARQFLPRLWRKNRSSTCCAVSNFAEKQARKYRRLPTPQPNSNRQMEMIRLKIKTQRMLTMNQPSPKHQKQGEFSSKVFILEIDEILHNTTIPAPTLTQKQVVNLLCCLECCRKARAKVSPPPDATAKQQSADGDDTSQDQNTKDADEEPAFSQVSEAEWVFFQGFHFGDRWNPATGQFLPRLWRKNRSSTCCVLSWKLQNRKSKRFAFSRHHSQRSSGTWRFLWFWLGVSGTFALMTNKPFGWPLLFRCVLWHVSNFSGNGKIFKQRRHATSQIQSKLSSRISVCFLSFECHWLLSSNHAWFSKSGNQSPSFGNPRTRRCSMSLMRMWNGRNWARRTNHKPRKMGSFRVRSEFHSSVLFGFTSLPESTFLFDVVFPCVLHSTSELESDSESSDGEDYIARRAKRRESMREKIRRARQKKR